MKWDSRGWKSPSDVLVDGADMGILLRDGRVFVGLMTLGGFHHTRDTLRLKLWGCVDAMDFRLEHVVGARLVREHTWAERQTVTKRQRRGEPGLVLPAVQD